MITEAELLKAAKVRGVTAKTLIVQLARWKQSPPWHEATVRGAAIESGYNLTTLEEILEQVKRDQAEKFTSRELHAAGASIGESQAVSATIGELDARAFSAETVIVAASLVGRQACMQEVLAEARRLREPSIANDDDVITVGELRAWLKRRSTLSTTTIRKDGGIDELAADIVSHREPEYPEGTVVRDAKKDWWFLNAVHKWESFGVSGCVNYDVPARPLTVVT